MNDLKFAVLGAGFWSNFQIAGWQELPGLQLIALCDPNLEKCQQLAKKFDIPNTYTDPKHLLEHENLDFVDIITEVNSHFELTLLAADHGLNIVCQKPMAPSLEQCLTMVQTCKEQGVKLFVNENFRWQAPIRKVKSIMEKGVIGTPFKARVSFCSAFPVFDNQPFLKQLDHFILTDIGSHVLDICRFLFGEADRLFCLTKRVNPDIQGEDVANVLMEMKNGMHCYAEMSYASILEREVFPQTLILIEGDKGSIELAANFTIKVTTTQGTVQEIVEPTTYDWIDPEYAVVHSSIVDTQADILNGLRGGVSETTGEDNYQTSRLIWASYWSAENNRAVELEHFE